MRTTSEGTGLPLAIATHVPAFAMRMGAGFLRFLGTRRTGVRTFREALLAGGMPADFADRLARNYQDAGSIVTFLHRAASSRSR